MYKILLIISLIFIVQNSFSQNHTINKDSAFVIKEKAADFLPLGSLLDSAYLHSPLLDQQEHEIMIKKIELKRKKYGFLQNISTFTEVKYGSADSYIMSENQAVAATNVSLRYSAGVGFRLTFSDLLDRKNQKKIAKEQIKKAEGKYNEIILSINIQITKSYGDLLQSKEILIIKTDALQSMNLVLQMVEKQFIDGEITLPDYSSVITSVSKSKVEYITAKNTYNNAYHLLKEIVGTEIRNK